MTRFKIIASYLMEWIAAIRDAPNGISGSDIKADFLARHPEIDGDAKKKLLPAVSFERTNCRAAGWLYYDETRWLWFLTEQGRKALEKYTDPVDLCHAAKKLYKLK